MQIDDREFAAQLKAQKSAFMGLLSQVLPDISIDFNAQHKTWSDFGAKLGLGLAFLGIVWWVVRDLLILFADQFDLGDVAHAHDEAIDCLQRNLVELSNRVQVGARGDAELALLTLNATSRQLQVLAPQSVFRDGNLTTGHPLFFTRPVYH